jgi:hypothetical protein
MEPMRPDEIDRQSNGEVQPSSADAAHRAAQDAEQAGIGRGGTGDSPRDWSDVHQRGRRDEEEGGTADTSARPDADQAAAAGPPAAERGFQADC